MNISKIVDVLSNGGLVIVPTDTVYGIIADATNVDAVKKVFEVKKRDINKPLLINVSNREMLNKYVVNINELEEKLINKYWPGEVTILLRKNDNIPSIVNNGGELLGVRIPNNEDIIKIINMLGKPIISTSANISGDDTVTSIDMIEEDLRKHVGYIYDGGIIGNNPSTIVKVENDNIIILRKGVIDINL